MKKITALLTIITILLSACVNSDILEESEAITDPNITITNTSAATATQPKNFVKPKKPEASPFPKLDGSTLTILLEAEIKVSFLNTTFEKAISEINRTPIEKSFLRLIGDDTYSEEPIDGLLSVSLTAKQKEMLAKANIELEMLPLTLEAFVFVVNKSNPVETLTTEQLRKIYSGEITNWSQVGGNNAEIKAFHNYDNSGSRNFMLNFMGDIPLTEDIYNLDYSTGWYIAAPHFDFGINSIGYAVYNHEDALYSGMNETKYIMVDGIAPTSENLNNGSYPITDNMYLMLDKTEPEDSAVRQLASFLKTDEGIAIIDRHCNISNENITPVKSVLGTGIPKPQNFTTPTFIYKVPENSRLIDKELERKISDDIRTVFPDLTDEQIWEKQSRGNWRHSWTEIINGYITFILEKGQLTYDLYTGERVEFSDFFFEGEAFTPYVNRSVLAVRRYSMHEGTKHFMKPFWGIKETQSSTVLFPPNSFYYQFGFSDSVHIYNDRRFINSSMSLILPHSLDIDYKIFAPSIPRNMDGMWENVDVSKLYIAHYANEQYENNGIHYSLFAQGEGYLNEEVRKKTNDYILSLSNIDSLKDFIRKNTDALDFDEAVFNHEDFFPVYISAQYCGDLYLIIHIIYFGRYEYDSTVITKHFNPNTFEMLESEWYHLSRLDKVFKEGWSDGWQKIFSGRGQAIPKSLDDLEVGYIHGFETTTGMDSIHVSFWIKGVERNQNYVLHVPREYLR